MWLQRTCLPGWAGVDALEEVLKAKPDSTSDNPADKHACQLRCAAVCAFCPRCSQSRATALAASLLLTCLSLPPAPPQSTTTSPSQGKADEARAKAAAASDGAAEGEPDGGEAATHDAKIAEDEDAGKCGRVRAARGGTAVHDGVGGMCVACAWLAA
jgi:hypothetical protein